MRGPEESGGLFQDVVQEVFFLLSFWVLSLIWGPKVPRGRSQVCSELRRVSLDPGSVHNLWGCDAAAGIHGVWGGKPAAGEGRPSPPGLSDEGVAMVGLGGMPAVSRGMVQAPLSP